MLQVSSAMKDYAIAAKDATIGTVSDFLFDQATWTVRWLVVDTGKWLTGRKVLVHPSAIDHVDQEQRQIEVALTKKQVEDSPDIGQDRPVSQQMQNDIYGYYGWDPLWNGGMYGAGMYGGGLYTGGLFAGGMGATGMPAASLAERDQLHGGPGWQGGNAGLALDEGDPNLRSVAEVTKYHVHAADGGIGHVEHVLFDTPSWSIRYLVVNTSNWWVGQHVLISPHAIKDIDWSDRSIRLDVTRAKVKASPPWNPSDPIDGTFERQLHEYYGWPGHRG